MRQHKRDRMCYCDDCEERRAKHMVEIPNPVFVGVASAIVFDIILFAIYFAVTHNVY